jgi:hypothetical protein
MSRITRAPPQRPPYPSRITSGAMVRDRPVLAQELRTAGAKCIPERQRDNQDIVELVRLCIRLAARWSLRRSSFPELVRLNWPGPRVMHSAYCGSERGHQRSHNPKRAGSIPGPMVRCSAAPASGQEAQRAAPLAVVSRVQVSGWRRSRALHLGGLGLALLRRAGGPWNAKPMRPDAASRSTAWPPPPGARPAFSSRSAPAFAPTPSRRFCGTPSPSLI